MAFFYRLCPTNSAFHTARRREHGGRRLEYFPWSAAIRWGRFRSPEGPADRDHFERVDDYSTGADTGERGDCVGHRDQRRSVCVDRCLRFLASTAGYVHLGWKADLNGGYHRVMSFAEELAVWIIALSLATALLIVGLTTGEMPNVGMRVKRDEHLALFRFLAGVFSLCIVIFIAKIVSLLIA